MNDGNHRMTREHVLITGGTGFIGTALAAHLLRRGARVSVLTRDAARASRHFHGRVGVVENLRELGRDAPDTIVNLAGKNLGEERWSDRVKRQLVDSRIDTTLRVVDYIAAAAVRPGLLISGSAVGYYGARGDQSLDEAAASGDEFQSQLCLRWEAAARQAETFGVRVCISRTGVVIGPGGGALSGLVPMFRRGLGAVAGSGDQWISWVHMEDLVQMFLRFMSDDALTGPFNNCAPTPVTNRDFARTIGRVLHRPVMLRAPGWAMRAMYGEMAHLYLTGQRVLPKRHLDAGFVYAYPDIETAVRAALA